MKSIKKLLSIIFAILIIASISSPALASSRISVRFNGKTMTFDQSPVIENNKVLVPMRAIFEALGAKVTWSQSKQTVKAVKDDITVSLTVGSNILTKNGEEIELDVAAKMIRNKVMVPIRAVAESFGASVHWNQSSRIVSIYDMSIFASDVVALVNAERTSRNIAALSDSDSDLCAAAMTRASEISRYYSHDRPDGSSCFTALDDHNVYYWTAGENIAYGYASPKDVVDAWMNSPGHRSNILNAGFSNIGVGVEMRSNGTLYWVQMFTG